MRKLGKKDILITTYKNMMIYYHDGTLLFGNGCYTSAKAKSLKSAKNLITRYINRKNKKNK